MTACPHRVPPRGGRVIGRAQGLLVAFALAVLATTSVASVRHPAHGEFAPSDPPRIDPVDHSIWLN